MTFYNGEDYIYKCGKCGKIKSMKFFCKSCKINKVYCSECYRSRRDICYLGHSLAPKGIKGKCYCCNEGN